MILNNRAILEQYKYSVFSQIIKINNTRNYFPSIRLFSLYLSGILINCCVFSIFIIMRVILCSVDMTIFSLHPPMPRDLAEQAIPHLIHPSLIQCMITMFFAWKCKYLALTDDWWLMTDELADMETFYRDIFP